MSNNETDNSYHNTFGSFEYFWDTAKSAEKSLFSSLRVKLDIYCLSEVTVIAVLGFAVARFYVSGVLGVSNYLNQYFWPIVALSILAGAILRRSGTYEISAFRDFATNIGHVASGLTGAFVIMALAGVLYGVSDDYSRIWFVAWLSFSLFAVWIMRAFATLAFSRWLESGAMRRRAVVYGDGKEADSFLSRFSMKNPYLDIVGHFGRKIGGKSRRRNNDLDALVELGQRSGFDLLVIAPNYNNSSEIHRVLNAVSMLPVEMKVIPPQAISNVALLGISRQGQHQLLDVQQSKISDWGKMFKLVEDYAIASIAAVALSWLLLVIAVAIRLESKGPILFRQSRTGLNNKEFMIYKFRTMVTDPFPGGFRQVERGDVRVTRVGQVLRKWSLDELPQLFNVLKGEMSIVGPRPHPIELNRIYAPQVYLFNKRHSVKPGITGWAQVHDHRGPIGTAKGMRQRLNYDLEYVDNWSFWLDLKIVLATPFLSLVHRNAM